MIDKDNDTEVRLTRSPTAYNMRRYQKFLTHNTEGRKEDNATTDHYKRMHLQLRDRPELLDYAMESENFGNFSDVNKFMKNFGSKFSTLELRSLELVYRWDLPKNNVDFCK